VKKKKKKGVPQKGVPTAFVTLYTAEL